MNTIFTTTSFFVPLALLVIIWFRFGIIDLRSLLLPQREFTDSANLEHLVVTLKTTGRAHDLVHVPHDPDSHSEPWELAVSWLVRTLDRSATRGPVAGEQRIGRTVEQWENAHELPYRD